MSQIRLTYFDFDGGRGEPIRIALHAAGIPFDDHRISFDEFRETRPKMRFTCVPVMQLDGHEITQSNSMLRYVGKKAKLYPTDDLQALYCDEPMDAVEDLLHHTVRTFGLEGEKLRQAREKLCDGWMTTIIKGLDELLQRGGGKYFADNRLTVADLKVLMEVRMLRGGSLDHVPTDLVDKLAPGLVEHQERIAKEPVVMAYYADRAERT